MVNYNTRQKSDAGSNGPAKNIQYYVPDKTKMQMEPMTISADIKSDIRPPFAETENRAPNFKYKNLDSLRANQGDDRKVEYYVKDEDKVMDLGTMDADPYDRTPPTSAKIFDQKEQPKEPSGFSQQDIDAVARWGSGASPTLLGFLTGASPASMYGNQTDAQNYYKAGTPNKLDLIKGPNGEPIYENVGNSVGKEAFQKPLKAGSGAAGTSTVNMINRKTGQSTSGIANRNTGTIIEYGTGKALNPDEWMPTVPTLDFQKSTQLSGAETIKPINKFVPGAEAPKTIGLNEGIGTRYNLPKEEVELGNKWAQKTATDIKPYLDGKNAIKGAMDLLTNHPERDNAIVQAAGIFRTAKLVVNERISDDERQFVTAAPDKLTNLANEIISGATGAQREKTLMQMKEILAVLDRVQANSIRMTKDNNLMAYSGGEKNKVKYFSDRLQNDIGLKPAVALPDSQVKYDPKTLKEIRPGPEAAKFNPEILKTLSTTQKKNVHDDLYNKLTPYQKSLVEQQMKGK